MRISLLSILTLTCATAAFAGQSARPGPPSTSPAQAQGPTTPTSGPATQTPNPATVPTPQTPAAQNPATPPQASPPPQTMTLSGCVAGGTGPNAFMLSSPTLARLDSSIGGASSIGVPSTGASSSTPAISASGYRLSGADVGTYVGQRVQVVGTLVPTPNAAATAGAISSGTDQNAATGALGTANAAGVGANAAIGTAGSTTPTTPLPEFRVQSIATVPGSPCPR